jgi:hypothetical protein
LITTAYETIKADHDQMRDLKHDLKHDQQARKAR